MFSVSILNLDPSGWIFHTHFHIDKAEGKAQRSFFDVTFCYSVASKDLQRIERENL